MEKYLIRNERPEERYEVENLIRESFWNVYRPGCLEHYVMHCLRDDPAFIPELNLVMEIEGKPRISASAIMDCPRARTPLSSFARN